MYNELTEKDIKQMQDEINYRVTVLRPKISQEIIEAKEHGDLSENAEYHASRKEKGKNEGRIRYLKEMIRTAKIIKPNTNQNEIGLFDKVEVYFEEDDETQIIELSTTMRNDASQGIISKESPFGKAILGRQVGDRILVKVNPEYCYHVTIKSIKKCSNDDVNLPIG